MALISLGLAIADQPRSMVEQGDIITGMKYPMGELGKMEAMKLLIINVDMGNIPLVKAKRLLNRWYASGLMDDSSEAPEILAFRRFKVDFQAVKDEYPVLVNNVDWKRVKDRGDPYQPLEGMIIPANKLRSVIYDKQTGLFLSDYTLGQING